MGIPINRQRRWKEKSQEMQKGSQAIKTTVSHFQVWILTPARHST